MKKLFTILSAMLLSVSAFAQTFNGGTWYSLYDTESHEMYTIANYTTGNVFAPTAGKLQFKWNYTKWMVGAFPKNATHIYTSADGGSNKVEVAKLTDNTWDTEHSEDIAIDANINWLKWDRPTGNTHYVHVWDIAVPLARHILLSSGDYGKTSVSKTFADAVKFGESASIRADFRSFLTNGDITISLTEGDAEVFRLGSVENTTGVLANSTAGNTYAVGANACASANGTANACANGQLAKIGNYSFQIYFCPKTVGAATATITITDGTSTATIKVSGTGVKGDQVEVPVELSFCSGTAAHFRDNDYIEAGTYDYLVESAIQDTLFKVNVTELQPTSSEENKTIVYGAAETWNEVDLSTYTVGNHDVFFNTTNAVGCDSTVTLHLTVNKMDTLKVPVALSFCEGGSVEYRGVEYTEGGNYEVPAEGETRDTLYIVNVTVLQPSFGTDEMQIVYGADTTWNGIALSDSTVGVHYVVYETTNAAGCDSTVTLTLTVNKQETLNVPVELSFCEGGSVEYRGVEYTEGGNYEVPAEGETRDTLYVVNVTVLQPSFGTDEMQIVYGADTAWNGIALKDSTVGVHYVVYETTNAAGCDSTVTLTLTVTKQDVEEVPVELVFCAGDSVEYRGVFYSEAGLYPVYAEGAERDTVYNVSVVVNEPSATSEEMTIVYGADTAWNGIALNDSTVGVHTLVYETTNVAGCDSIVTLTLTVEKQQTVETYYPIGICPGDSAEYRGKWYYESVEDTIYAEGEICDTIIYVQVVILPTSYEIQYDTVLSGYAITLPEGEWVIGEDTVSGTYPTVQSAEETVLTFYQYGHIDDGCEAIIELNVLVQSNFEAIDNIFVGEKAVKELRNGVIYIRRGGKEFTTDGQMVK